MRNTEEEEVVSWAPIKRHMANVHFGPEAGVIQFARAHRLVPVRNFHTRPL